MSGIKNISHLDQPKANYKTTNTKNTNKSQFSSFLGETKSLDSIFDKASQKYNVPVNLLKAIGKAESNFNPKAVSPVGAQGVMQLMPSTATSLGVKDSLDAEQNIMGGAKYISSLLKKYDGNTNFALAAYNAGMGNVAKYGGIPPFKETQNYVVKVTQFMKQGVSTGNAMVSTSVQTKAPVSVNTKSVIMNQGVSSNVEEDKSASSEEMLSDLFSYQEYLDFLDKLLGSAKEAEKDQEQKSDYFASRQINYSVPVLNLIRSRS